MQDTRPIAQLSGPKPTMLASSVQAVVACNVTVLRVCTLVLFIKIVMETHRNDFKHMRAGLAKPCLLISHLLNLAMATLATDLCLEGGKTSYSSVLLHNKINANVIDIS